MDPWLFALAGAALLLVLALRLRGDRRGDLIAPPGRKPKHLAREELDRLMDLVGRGEEEQAVRQLKSAGYDEAAARRLVGLMDRLAAPDGERPARP